MTGARITLEYDTAGLQAALSQAVAALASPGDLMDAVGAVIEEAVDRRFDTASDASGSAWPESQRARLGLRGGRTLTDSGRLRASISRSVSGPEVAVGTNLVYGAIHHFGGTIVPRQAGGALRLTGADGESVVAGSVTLPARPWLEIDARAEADIADVVTEYLRQALSA